MRKSTAILLSECQTKMSGNAALFNYRLLNLCVNAEAASLLPVTIEYDDEEYNIEDVANVSQPQPDLLQVFPKAGSMLLHIGKAIATVHPEYKQEVMVEQSNGEYIKLEDCEDDVNDEDKSLLLTAPPVNKDRKDVLMDGVKLFFDELKGKIELLYTTYGEKVATKLNGADAEEIDEAKEILDNLKKKHMEIGTEYHDNKVKEIEEAYQKYQKLQEEKVQSQQEEYDAKNKDVTQGFKFPESSEE